MKKAREKAREKARKRRSREEEPCREASSDGQSEILGERSRGERGVKREATITPQYCSLHLDRDPSHLSVNLITPPSLPS